MMIMMMMIIIIIIICWRSFNTDAFMTNSINTS